MQMEYELSRERDENIFIQADEDGVYHNHFHRKVEIMYVLEGEKHIVVGGKPLTLRKNQIFIADSYMLHCYLESPGSKQIIIVFPNMLLEHYYARFGGEVLSENVIRDEKICFELKKYVDNIVQKKGNPLFYQANVDMLLGSIVDIVGIEKQTACDSQDFAQKVLAYINENYTDEITLDEMAEHFGYSKYYFSRLFNKVMHTNISDYVSIIRLMHAIDLLKTTHCTVSEAALESGFSSIPTFYRALKYNYHYKTVKDLL